eukprot:TRINITY_DN106150_c0_g1_i1.p1 TRINITY_DN106150_c0_g1~~TRINITY_DN106150_c0_g1_i1.p1  ORF type:complete len:288 (+),score=42.97 TRINITY_DN106150_c0_g1_i1:37-900(+)
MEERDDSLAGSQLVVADDAASEDRPAENEVNQGTPIATDASERQLAVDDRVRLHSLQAARDMNGRFGRLKSFDPSDGRWLVRLEGDGADVRVKAANAAKVAEISAHGPPASRKSARVSAASASKALKALPDETDEESLPDVPVDVTKQKALKRPGASIRTINGSTKRGRPGTSTIPIVKAKSRASRTSAASESSVFNVRDYFICSEPSLQVWDSDGKRWRPAHLYSSIIDGRIVIWYGGAEYEGLYPSRPYTILNVPKNSSDRPSFTGSAPGVLLDSDGEIIPTRAR